ncbi:MAG: sulfite exporter TauE/SafE family protein [Candidatus Hydrogenedentales bacterium]
MEGLIAGGLAVFIGAFVQGCLGFGFGMIALPILLLFFAATTIVPLIGMLGMINTTYMLYRCRHDVRPRLVLGLSAGAAVGLPIGVAVLKTLDGPPIKIFVGVLMIVLALILLSGWQRPVKRLRWAVPGAGFLSGFLGGSTSVADPPLILFLANQATPKNEFRATMVAYFTLMAVYALVVFYLNKLVTRDVMQIWLQFAPVMVLGTLAGVQIGDRIQEALFRRLVMICAALLGALLVVVNALQL